MAALPASYSKLQAHAVSADFRKATAVVTVPLKPPKAKEVLIRVLWAGVNASDINWTAAKYNPSIKPPFDTGFEILGQIAALGEGVSHVRVGDSVIAFANGAFAEFATCPAAAVIPVPSPDPGYLTLLVSGLTASIALEEVGALATNETVLVTAAAGGTGMLAVQLAKQAGNFVVGTCSSDDKVDMLKRVGCDRVINYKKEDLGSVPRKEFPKGIDLIYESVGGQTFDTCLRNVAVKGRVLIIGSISGYQDGSAFQSAESGRPRVEIQLLQRSASLRGFFLSHYTSVYPAHLVKLMQMHRDGKLQLVVDKQPFVGLGAVADALDHLYRGRNAGKVVVRLSQRPAAL